MRHVPFHTLVLSLSRLAARRVVGRSQASTEGPRISLASSYFLWLFLFGLGLSRLLSCFIPFGAQNPTVHLLRPPFGYCPALICSFRAIFMPKPPSQLQGPLSLEEKRRLAKQQEENLRLRKQNPLVPASAGGGNPKDGAAFANKVQSASIFGFWMKRMREAWLLKVVADPLASMSSAKSSLPPFPGTATTLNTNL